MIMPTLSRQSDVNTRRIAVLLPFILTLMLLLGPIHSVFNPQSSVLSAPEAPALLLGVGDSLMVGVGASLPEDRGEFGLVADLMRGRYGPNLRAVNVAIPGETSTTLLTPSPPPAPAAGAPTPTPIRPQIALALDELGRLTAGGRQLSSSVSAAMICSGWRVKTRRHARRRWPPSART